MQDDASFEGAGPVQTEHRMAGPKGESDMAARKAKAVAKALAVSREEELQRIWTFTIASAVTLAAVTAVLLSI
jgi:hypothetical protein